MRRGGKRRGDESRRGREVEGRGGMERRMRERKRGGMRERGEETKKGEGRMRG